MITTGQVDQKVSTKQNNNSLLINNSSGSFKIHAVMFETSLLDSSHFWHTLCTEKLE